jgi:hypothetical protein
MADTHGFVCERPPPAIRSGKLILLPQFATQFFLQAHAVLHTHGPSTTAFCRVHLNSIHFKEANEDEKQDKIRYFCPTGNRIDPSDWLRWGRQ